MSHQDEGRKNLAVAVQGPSHSPTQHPAPLLLNTHAPLTEFQPARWAHDGSHEERAIAVLAHRAHVPMAYVAQLYIHKLAVLTVGARITGFLPLLALKKVRTLLRHIGQAARLPARPPPLRRRYGTQLQEGTPLCPPHSR